MAKRYLREWNGKKIYFDWRATTPEDILLCVGLFFFILIVVGIFLS